MAENEIVINPELVTALDLDQWSSSLNAQSTLPVLVRRLILATASAVEIAMRGREGTQLPGWDGLVQANGGDPHVPAGTSAWEMGTSKEPRGKAQADYRARTDNPLGVDPANTTFVAVTSRLWRDRDDWRAARKSECRWADVRAYDADDLETWLERAPSVHIWLSELLGREPRNVSTPERWWASWSSLTHPVLPRSFLLAGRNAASELREALARSSQVITVDAPSKEEALAVICAVLGDDNDDVANFAPRSVVISGAGAWDRLVESDTALVLIPAFEEPDVSTALSRGHRVVVPAARVVRSRGVEVKVGPLDQLKAAEALIELAGLDRETADKYSAHAHRNLLSLRRTIAISPTFKRPSWAQSQEGGRLVPLLLAGAWRQDSDGDRGVITALAGRPYPDIEKDIAAWSMLEDAPLRRTGRAWSVVSKDDAWDLVSPIITPTDLRRFREIAVRVLGEPDPALDLPPERRFMAAVVGEPRTYSLTLRGDIADTIAFLGGYAGDDRLPDGATGQEYADLLVQAVTWKLNADPTGRAWQSLADVLPLLAEASPDRFLDAVQAGLAGDHPPLSLMFLDSEATTFGASSPHFSLVWALETLAWSPDHLSRATVALARLAEIDPEPHGRSNPRPAGSLANIFRLYWPQTSAPLQRRIAVIDRLRRQAPAASWSLLLAVLPAPGVGFPTHRPRWRSWAQEQVDQISPAEVAVGTAQAVTRLLEDAGTDAERWTDLIGHMDVLPSGDRDRVLNVLESLDPDNLGDPGSVSVWRALVGLSSRHRQFEGAGWVMASDAVERIEQAAARFAPASLIDLHANLFDHHPQLPGIDARDHTAYDATLRAARTDAVSAVIDRGGVTDLLALGSAAKLPQAVGWAAAEARGDELAGELLPRLDADGSDRQVAQGYAADRIEADGIDWIRRQLKRADVTWTTTQQAGLLLAVPRPSVRLLALVKRFPADVQEVFWRRINPIFAEPDARPAIARELIERRRPWSAITVLVSSLPSSGQAGSAPPEADLVELALYQAATGPSDDVQQAASLTWEVKELLDYLERVGSDGETRARLEFLFMPLLQYTRPARALEEALRTRPALFAEIMSIVYRAENDPDDQPVPPERKALAEVGFTVLRSWHTPPGVRPDGTIDVHRLREWISEARTLLAASGRRAIGDIVIGEVLADAPADNDGLWPALPIRDLLEDLDSAELAKGLETGKFNSRGIITRDPASGGELERALARQFRGWAERVADEWPKTAAMLRGLAATYETWGRREDDQTENFADYGNYSRLSRISQIAEDQWGLVTRRQAELAGISDATLQRLVANGVLERVAHEVYLMGAAMPDHLDLRAAWLQLAPKVPAWERTADQGVVSHRSAAALYGLGHLPADRHDFTFPRPHPSQRPDVRIHQRELHQGDWLRLHGLPVTRPSRIAADLLDTTEDPEAIAHVVTDAIRAVYDYPDAFVDALAPYAASFRLTPGDGLALLRWLLDLVGDPETERWMNEARMQAARSPDERYQRPPPYPDVQNLRR